MEWFVGTFQWARIPEDIGLIINPMSSGIRGFRVLGVIIISVRKSARCPRGPTLTAWCCGATRWGDTTNWVLRNPHARRSHETPRNFPTHAPTLPRPHQVVRVGMTRIPEDIGLISEQRATDMFMVRPLKFRAKRFISEYYYGGVGKQNRGGGFGGGVYSGGGGDGGDGVGGGSGRRKYMLEPHREENVFSVKARDDGAPYVLKFSYRKHTVWDVLRMQRKEKFQLDPARGEDVEQAKGRPFLMSKLVEAAENGTNVWLLEEGIRAGEVEVGIMSKLVEAVENGTNVWLLEEGIRRSGRWR